MPRIMAIDYGLKRTGIAVTDPLCMIASPLDTIETSRAVNWIVDYARRESVHTLVIGEPISMDNREQELESYIRSFIVDLTGKIPEIKIERMDERFTTTMAHQAIRQSGIGKMDRRDKSLADKVSAAILLQSYLDKRSASK